jgi:hypothetical protein
MPNSLIHEEIIKYNGVEWPQMCIDKTQTNFFGIGDWGGMLGYYPGNETTPMTPTPFNNSKGRVLNEVDTNAQMLVARMMNELAATSKPDFVLNVGDNFYPGGIGTQCGVYDGSGKNPSCDPATSAFRPIFEQVYNATELQGKPWLSCLGNHDYGGTHFDAGYDIQIYRTWCNASNGVPNNRWRMPGQYWSQKIQYADFAVDVFLLDSNTQDAHPTGVDPGHNICNDGKVIPPCPAMTNKTCAAYFSKLWTDGMAFLEAGLKKSTAEWKIVVTHYPADGIAAFPDFQKLSKTYGIDLLFTGHRHIQSHGYESTAGTNWIVSGGGGGISADAGPSLDGKDDAYGFVDFAINRTHMRYDMHSHGGLNHDVIIRASKTLTPRGKSSDVSSKVVV